MGWDSYSNPYYTKPRVVANLIEGTDFLSPSYPKVKVVAYSLRGGRLWRVIEKEDGTRFIALDLIRAGGRDSGCYTKSLSEYDQPAYYDCPLYFFNLVPNPDEATERWRAQVREHHNGKAQLAKQQKKIVPGTYVMNQGRRFKVAYKLKRGWAVSDTEGTLYRTTGKVTPCL